MKAMKLAAFLMAATIPSFFAFAEIDVMDINFSDGYHEYVPVSEVENMAIEQVNFNTETPTINRLGHDAVDLGLPSGTLWATCNLDASRPTQYGRYLAWGEFQAKNQYNIFESEFTGWSFQQLRSQGIIDANGNLKSDFDVVYQDWGGGWHIPTKEQCQELIDNCIFTWSFFDYDAYGAIVTGPNGNTIFLPAAGRRTTAGFYKTIYWGEYWSANFSDSSYARDLFFTEDSSTLSVMDFYVALPIRPVTSYTSVDM